MNRLLRLAAAAAAVAIAVAACGSGADSADSAAPATSAAVTSAAVTSSAAPVPSAGAGKDAATAATITIKDFRYGAPVTVAPGAQVTVTNEDTAGHDVVSDDDGKFRTPTLGKGEKAVFTAPTEPGTYKYSCSLHANMTGIGTLIVSG